MAMHRSQESRASAVTSLALGLLAVLGWCRPGIRVGPEPQADVIRACCWAAWAIAGYLVAGVGLAAAAYLPGPLGRAGRWAGRLTPRPLRRSVDLVVGTAAALAVVTAPTIAQASPGSPSPSPAPGQAWEAPSLDWPLEGPTLRVARPAASPTVVVVRPGDSLWTISARHDPGAKAARIAAEWPSWWAANRAVIGADPDLIHPGQRLTPPTHDDRTIR
jgi:resuscitation-promoting factor RpfA